MELKYYKHKVHYYETDQMGIVHHSNYIRWFEEARVDLLDQLGFSYSRMEFEKIVIPVLSISCEYKSTVHFPDEVVIVPKVETFNGLKFTVSYRIFDAVTEEIKTLGGSKHCFLGVDFKPIQLQKVNPKLYDIFAGIVGMSIDTDYYYK